MIPDSDSDDEDPRPAPKKSSKSANAPVPTAPVQRDYEFVHVPQYVSSTSSLPAEPSFQMRSVLHPDKNEHCAAVTEYGVHRGTTFTRKLRMCFSFIDVIISNPTKECVQEAERCLGIFRTPSCPHAPGWCGAVPHDRDRTSERASRALCGRRATRGERCSQYALRSDAAAVRYPRLRERH